MPKITIKKYRCPKCNEVIKTKTIDIKHFKKDMFTISRTMIRIWRDKKHCWICGKKPEIGEVWGLSINNDIGNKIYCPSCSGLIEKKLKERWNATS